MRWRRINILHKYMSNIRHTHGFKL